MPRVSSLLLAWASLCLAMPPGCAMATAVYPATVTVGQPINALPAVWLGVGQEMWAFLGTVDQYLDPRMM
jgi:hypothetical protein